MVERLYSKYGSAIFTKPDLYIISTGITEKNNIKTMTINRHKTMHHNINIRHDKKKIYFIIPKYVLVLWWKYDIEIE